MSDRHHAPGSPPGVPHCPPGAGMSPDLHADVERYLPLHPEAFRILLVLRGGRSTGTPS